MIHLILPFDMGQWVRHKIHTQVTGTIHKYEVFQDGSELAWFESYNEDGTTQNNYCYRTRDIEAVP